MTSTWSQEGGSGDVTKAVRSRKQTVGTMSRDVGPRTQNNKVLVVTFFRFHKGRDMILDYSHVERERDTIKGKEKQGRTVCRKF